MSKLPQPGKSSPIPVRLHDAEVSGVDSICDQTGLSRSEVIRRAINLMFKEYSSRGNAAFLFQRGEVPAILREGPAAPQPPARPVRYGRPRKERRAGPG